MPPLKKYSLEAAKARAAGIEAKMTKITTAAKSQIAHTCERTQKQGWVSDFRRLAQEQRAIEGEFLSWGELARGSEQVGGASGSDAQGPAGASVSIVEQLLAEGAAACDAELGAEGGAALLPEEAAQLAAASAQGYPVFLDSTRDLRDPFEVKTRGTENATRLKLSAGDTSSGGMAGGNILRPIDHKGLQKLGAGHPHIHYLQINDCAKCKDDPSFSCFHYCWPGG